MHYIPSNNLGNPILLSLLAASLVLLSCLNCRIVLAEVYLGKNQALDLVLGKDCEHIYHPQKVGPELRQKLEKNNLWWEEGSLGADSESAEPTAHFFVCQKGGSILSYALIDAEVGKHLPITYIVGFNLEGEVSMVEIMVFREIRGSEVRFPDFRAQFKGKNAAQPLRIGAQIKNISGATYSAKAIIKGVNRGLEMWKFFYGKK